MEEESKGMPNPVKAVMTHSIVKRVLHMNNAKVASIICLTCVVIYQLLEHADKGKSITCGRLLNGGHLVDKETVEWATEGCVMHNYNENLDIYDCLQDESLSFVGDSRIRSIFYAFANKVFPDQKFKDEKADFYWLPELNNSDIEQLQKKWTSDGYPTYLFQSAGTHTIKRLNGSINGHDDFENKLKAYLPIVKDLVQEKNRKTFWILQGPVDHEKLTEARKMITNSEIEYYNYITEKNIKIQKNSFTLVDSFSKVDEYYIHDSEDGIHLPFQALDIEVSMLLNLVCNNKIKPIDGSCCQDAPPFTPVQILLAILATINVFLFVVSKIKRSLTHDYSPVQDVESAGTNQADKFTDNKFSELTYAILKMSLILLYFYVCDRTTLFMKANKHFNLARFFIPLIYVAVLGVFGIEQTKQQSFLNRDQTDEWKGWMQLIILIYHMSGASVNVPIYMNIRLLVGMYLFMTGYGHFSYFWNKADYSIYRVTNVLFRLNFLTVCLCCVMNRSYQFYYFVPLCTFWFLLLYLFMSIWPRVHAPPKNIGSNGTAPNGKIEHSASKNNILSLYIMMAFKLFAFLGFISIILLSQEVFMNLFSWWPIIHLFEYPQGFVREWFFRFQLDRYALLHGAVFSFLYIILKRLSVLDDAKQGCLLSTKISLISITLSLATIIGYILWTIQCTSKPLCNNIHSYFSFLPISSFILLRNIPGYFRSGYSTFFAWFGKISLELFIGQYHIWLAADTKGILVLLTPNYPTVNFVFISLIFVSVAHEINFLTGIFAKYFMGSPKDGTKYLLFKLSILTVLLLFFSNLNKLYSLI